MITRGPLLTVLVSTMWLVATLEQLQIDRAHLVGHLSGANIIMQLARDAPQKVRPLALLESALPVPSGSPGRAGIPKADTFFGQELPAIQQWTFGPTEAARIKQPVLLVMGGPSARGLAERLGAFFTHPPAK